MKNKIKDIIIVSIIAILFFTVFGIACAGSSGALEGENKNIFMGIFTAILVSYILMNIIHFFLGFTTIEENIIFRITCIAFAVSAVIIFISILLGGEQAQIAIWIVAAILSLIFVVIREIYRRRK